jgi:hypothetical protein
MAIDTAQHHVNGPTGLPAGLLARAVDQVRQFFCGLHGHDALLHFEQSRMSLQCTTCGYETPGWDLTTAPAHTDAVQPVPRIVRVPFARERRVA